MNKQQKDYLVSKIRNETLAAIAEYAKGREVKVPVATKLAALKKAGFIITDNTAHYTGYLSMEPTAAHKKNQSEIEKFKEKVTALQNNAIDVVNLGDSKDALAILKDFTEQLKKIK